VSILQAVLAIYPWRRLNESLPFDPIRSTGEMHLDLSLLPAWISLGDGNVAYGMRYDASLLALFVGQLQQSWRELFEGHAQQAFSLWKQPLE
jgi:hypothetical protein